MMKRIRTIIIDDEKLARSVIRNYLKDNPDIEIIDECSNGFEGIKKINVLKPELIFLDIQMPKISGFEMLELIEKPPVIIFTTAFDQFALKAFEVNAADYLLKPFSQDRFKEGLSKALLRLRDKSDTSEVIKSLIIQNELKAEFLERIVIKDGPRIAVVQIEDVQYLEAQDDYVMVYTRDGKFLKQKTMKYFEEHLNPRDFVRIHRTYIAPVKRIKKIELLEKESYQIVLEDKSILPMSKSGYDKLKEILK
jgi:two-component system LytT family response regulator